jgi:FkbM family methyltransferase
MNDPRPFGAFAPTGFAKWAIERTRRMPDHWAGRRLAFMLRHMTIPFLRGAPVDAEAFGARMRLYPYNNICEKKALFTPQFFDPREFAVLRTALREDFTFVDIGASVGAYTLFVAALAGPKAQILAVEPQPDVFDRLVFNIRQNPFGTVKAVACAVADKAGDLTLFLDHRNKGQSSVKIVGLSEAGSVRVPAMTLLGLLRQEGFSRVDAVKLDVQGAEDLILSTFFRDAPKSLHPSLFLIENGRERWQLDLPELVESNGYRLREQTRLNLIFEKV